MGNPKGRPKGYRLSAESIAKISKSKTGYRHTEETKEKISDSVFDWWTNNPTLTMLEKDRKCMCRTRRANAMSLFLLKWWEEHPEIKRMMSERMKAWHAIRATQEY